LNRLMNGSRFRGLFKVIKRTFTFLKEAKHMDLGKRKLILMNSIYALFLVTLLLFSALMPAAFASDGEQVESEGQDTDTPGQPSTQELADPDGNAVIKNGFVPKRIDPEFALSNWIEGMPVKPITTTDYSNSGEPQNSRARANEDLEMTQLEFGTVNDGWAAIYDDPNMGGNQGYLGSFMVGVSTTITASVRNNGGNSVSNVKVNFTIYDYTTALFKGILLPGAQYPTTKTISSINSGQTQQATFDWTPPFAGYTARAGDLARSYSIVARSHWIRNAMLNGYPAGMSQPPSQSTTRSLYVY